MDTSATERIQELRETVERDTQRLAEVEAALVALVAEGEDTTELRAERADLSSTILLVSKAIRSLEPKAREEQQAALTEAALEEIEAAVARISEVGAERQHLLSEAHNLLARLRPLMWQLFGGRGSQEWDMALLQLVAERFPDLEAPRPTGLVPAPDTDRNLADLQELADSVVRPDGVGRVTHIRRAAKQPSQERARTIAAAIRSRGGETRLDEIISVLGPTETELAAAQHAEQREAQRKAGDRDDGMAHRIEQTRRANELLHQTEQSLTPAGR